MSVKSDLLKEALDVFFTADTFKVGDVVVQKRGMELRKSPTQNDPGVVVEILPEPIITKHDESQGSPLFREPVDILVGRIDDDGDFVIHHHDSRRLEHYKED